MSVIILFLAVIALVFAGGIALGVRFARTDQRGRELGWWP